MLFTCLFLGILIGGLIPKKATHGLIVSIIFLVHFILQFNLIHPGFELWEITVLQCSFAFGGYALVIVIVGLIIKWLIRRFFLAPKDKTTQELD